MIQLLLALSLALPGVPDTSRRTEAWRAIDTYVSGQDCASTCNPRVPNATRDTLCIQAALDYAKAYPDTPFKRVAVPASGTCYIDDTITITDQWGLDFGGGGVQATTLVWAGADNVPMFQLDDVRDATFHDFSVYVTAASGDLKEVFNTKNGAGSTVTPTNLRVERVYVNATGTDAYLEHFLNADITGAGGDNNQDFYAFRDVAIDGVQLAAFVVGGAQMKGFLFDRVTVTGGSAASGHSAPASKIVESYGCFSWHGGGGGYTTDVDFDLIGNGCPYSIDSFNGEGSLKFLRTGGPTSATLNVAVTNSRWSANGVARGASGTDRYVVDFLYNGGLTLTNNTIGDDGAGSWTTTADAGTDVVTLAGSPGPDLIVDLPVYFTSTGTLPAPLVSGTTYYVKTAPTSATATLAASAGGALIDLTDAGSGVHTAHVANARNLALRLYSVPGGGAYLLQSNFIGTLLTGSSLWPYATPVNAVANTVAQTTNAGSLMGVHVPLTIGAADINVVDFGAIPDDGVDDTAAFQRALDAAPDGGVVLIPNGTLTVDPVSTDKSVVIRGAGAPKTVNSAVWGDSSWTVDQEVGTILEAGPIISAVGGDMITVNPSSSDPRVTLENFGVKSTSTDTIFVRRGLVLGGTRSPRLSLKNVSAYNFETGISITNAQDGTFDGVQARGNGVGVYIGTNANSNVWTGIDLNGNNTSIKCVGASENYFVGGSVQGHHLYGIRLWGCSETTFQNMYFESSVGAAKAMSFEGLSGGGAKTFAATASDDRLTTPTAHGWAVNSIVHVRAKGGYVLPAGLSATDYYIKSVPTSTTMTLSTTLGGATVDITADSGGGDVLYVYPATTSDHNHVLDCHFGAAGDAIQVYGNDNVFDMTTGYTGITLGTATGNNIVKDFTASTFSDIGAGNTHIRWTAGVATRYGTPAATTEIGQYIKENGPFTGLWLVNEAGQETVIDNRYDVGATRVVDAVTNAPWLYFYPGGSEPTRRMQAVTGLGISSTYGLSSDNIFEYNSGAGVTVDGVRLKDGGITVADETTPVTTNSIVAGALSGGFTNFSLAAGGGITVTSTGSFVSLNAGGSSNLELNTDTGNIVGIAGGGISLTSASIASLTSSGDEVDINSGGAGVYVQNALFTGADAASSALAIDAITATGTIIGNLIESVGGNARLTTTGVLANVIDEVTAGNGVAVNGLKVDQAAAAIGNTADQTITGGGTGVQYFTTQKITVPSNRLKANDRVHIHALWKVTAKSTFTALVPNVYWGGSGGQALFVTGAIINPASGDWVTGDVYLVFRTIGASPVWTYTSEWRTNGNTGYTSYSSGFDLTTQATNAAIDVTASAQFTGAGGAGDSVKLYDLNLTIERNP